MRELSKKELRRTILDRRKSLTQEEVSRFSLEICDRIRKMDIFSKSEDLCIYMPIQQEVDPRALLDTMREKRVWIPKVAGETMYFNAYEEENLSEGAFHIPESSSEEILSPGEDTLIIMPGAVFDERGNRIGYGGGYYDRYLAENPQVRRIGVCFDFQIVERIPVEDHDISPEFVVSEKRMIRGRTKAEGRQ